MSSAEVYAWGALLPEPIDEECLDPLAAGRSKLVRGVHAGYGQAILAGNDHAKWVGRDSSGYKVMEIGVDSENSLASESAAIGQTHALLLLRKPVARDGVSDTVAKPGSGTEVLAFGSGLQGQVCECTPCLLFLEPYMYVSKWALVSSIV